VVWEGAGAQSPALDPIYPQAEAYGGTLKRAPRPLNVPFLMRGCIESHAGIQPQASHRCSDGARIRFSQIGCTTPAL
jgi:hypothetical protein